MKGVILAAGKGTRLLPNTKIIPKVLLPVYDKPMIFYAIQAMVDAGIKDIMIVASPIGEVLIAKTIENEFEGKVNVTFKSQENSMGSVDAFKCTKDFIRGDDCLLFFGDNILIDVDFNAIVKEGIENIEKNCSSIITYSVPNPKELGVVEVDSNGNILSIEEKPEYPKSDLASIGVYIYTKDVVDIMDMVPCGVRGEYEVTDLNKIYLNAGRLKAIKIEKGDWFDTGNPDSLLKASNSIKNRKYGE